MTEASRATPDLARHEDCRHLVWQESPESDGPSPGPYCVNPEGVFPLLDCPCLQGRSCRRFAPRSPAEGPPVRSRADLEAIARRLAEDYLTRRYWRRVRALVTGDPGEEP